jgi:hypothetical protein
MSHDSGTVVAFVPHFCTGAKKERGERLNPGSRFTPLLSRRETWVAMKRKAGEARTFSAICFPGWDRG